MIDRTISHYKILEKLGEGGMGVVYRAQDTRLNRSVAVKFLSVSTLITEEDKKRFVNEARAAAALSHPNICKVHEIDEAEGRTFIAMEHVHGRGLNQMISSGPISNEDVLDIAIQIGEGLKHAHERGIVHRDIKASNIMITDKGRAIIMDFGLAQIAGVTRITHSLGPVGTLAYMSPEHASGDLVDHRTDIWSLGVLLYEMSTGRLPFNGEHEAALIYSILNQDPQSLAALRPDAPAGLEQVVSQMLEKDRRRRIQPMWQVLRVLREIRETTIGPKRPGIGKTIAVLPFTNISPDKESDYFSDGLAEELLTSLSKLKGVKVVSRTTSMHYKGSSKDTRSIGREIGARYIVEGSVRRLKDDLRISVQLVDVDSDSQLWAETYKGVIADVFDIQENVSRQVVEALMLKLTPSENAELAKRSTLNPDAFDFYLRGRDLLYGLTKAKLKSAIGQFEKAIELDPRYAAAYAGLGETCATLYQNYERDENWLEKSIESCLSALMYDSRLSEAYAALGLSYFQRKSVEEAVEACQKAIDLDPNSFTAYWILGRIFHSMERDGEAVNCFERVIGLNPEFFTAYKDLAMSYERLGRREDYDRALRESLEVYPRHLKKHPDDGRAHMYFAVNLAEVGRVEEAKLEAATALKLSPTEPLMFYNAACFYSRIGDKELALKSLGEAVSAGFEYYDWIKADPDLDSIRAEPGYLKLLEGK